MKAISVRSPWWWFILHAGKDIENRDWPTRFRGTVLLHASKWFQQEEILDDCEDVQIIRQRSGIQFPTTVELTLTLRKLMDARGCIVGKVDVVDCVKRSDSPWFFGEYGFVLANPVAFAEPVPFKGALGFFEVPGAIVAGAK